MSREPEACDWCPKPATKRIEDVRGYETAVACDGCVKYGIRYVLPINDPRCGDRHDDDDPEGGVSVPSGDSPDSPPAGESRLPGRDSIPIAPGLAAYDPSIAWPVLPLGATYESGDTFKLWQGPDGTWHSEIVPPVLEESAP